MNGGEGAKTDGLGEKYAIKSIDI